MDNIIDVKNLTKRFGNFTAVNNITFQVKRGEIFGFLGANGAGKSTAIRMLCGLSLPTSGSGTVVGYDILDGERKHPPVCRNLRHAQAGNCRKVKSTADVAGH